MNLGVKHTEMYKNFCLRDSKHIPNLEWHVFLVDGAAVKNGAGQGQQQGGAEEVHQRLVEYQPLAPSRDR